jgi:hypothetical protein
MYILGRRISAITGPSVQSNLETKTSENPPHISRYSVELEDFSEKLTCNLIISSPDHIPPPLLKKAKHIPSSTSSNGIQSYSSIARCIAIIDRPISFSATSLQPESSSLSSQDSALPLDIDTAVLVFPPSSLAGGSTTTAVHVLITGPGCLATPSGKCTFSHSHITRCFWLDSCAI